MLVVPAALLALAIWAAWNLGHRHEVSSSASAVMPATVVRAGAVPVPRDGAEKIARDRLSRGEITTDDYRRIISVLRG